LSKSPSPIPLTQFSVEPTYHSSSRFSFVSLSLNFPRNVLALRCSGAKRKALPLIVFEFYHATMNPLSDRLIFLLFQCLFFQPFSVSQFPFVSPSDFSFILFPLLVSLNSRTSSTKLPFRNPQRESAIVSPLFPTFAPFSVHISPLPPSFLLVLKNSPRFFSFFLPCLPSR